MRTSGRAECSSLQADCRSARPRPFLRLCIGLLALTPATSNAARAVDAKIGKESAWTGEAVPLFVTLYAPGPFSGTAAFDLPELPRTAIIKVGRPVVANETVDGEPLFTQRHEFILYTQRSGAIAVPPFQVRFAGKKTFLGAPEPIEGTTPELRYQSHRPPGTKSLGVVIAATEMEVRQTWLPEDQETLQAGDVIGRTVTRTASGTTAMMFQPAATSAPDAVRIHTTNPIVEDTTDRGRSMAKRVETIKYQFEAPGTFELPAIEFVWWDPVASELKRDSVAGKIITVEGESAEVVPASAELRSNRLVSTAAVLIAGFIGWLLFKPARHLLAWQLARWNSPEAIAARNVRSACRANDAIAAYAAVLNWKRACTGRVSRTNWDAIISSEKGAELRRQWSNLSRQVFGVEAGQADWSGKYLQQTFTHARRELKHRQKSRKAESDLPGLNPTE